MQKVGPLVSTPVLFLLQFFYYLLFQSHKLKLLRLISYLITLALGIYQKLLGPSHPEVGEALNSLALVAKLEGDMPTALKLVQDAIKIVKDALGTPFLDFLTY